MMHTVSVHPAKIFTVAVKITEGSIVRYVPVYEPMQYCCINEHAAIAGDTQLTASSTKKKVSHVSKPDVVLIESYEKVFEVGAPTATFIVQAFFWETQLLSFSAIPSLLLHLTQNY